ncbi:hypothetical protein Xen7305DRAFT_00009130 [Xenococcus sp. PCC 7305]|nr:hypothetical protein Xen7305DRAFT_00009130 [Xenococcus sp. PCC 7305]
MQNRYVHYAQGFIEIRSINYARGLFKTKDY